MGGYHVHSRGLVCLNTRRNSCISASNVCFNRQRLFAIQCTQNLWSSDVFLHGNLKGGAKFYLILTIVDNKLGVYLANTGGKEKFSLFRRRKFHFSTSFCFQETELNCLKSKILKNYRLPLLIFVTMIFTFRIYSFSMSSILP